MKKVLGLIAIVGFVACNSATDAVKDAAAGVDTMKAKVEAGVDTMKAKVEAGMDTLKGKMEAGVDTMKAKATEAVGH